jgi:RHS repeat-associated protein
MTDPLGRTATFVNDPFGRVTALTRPDGRQVTFGYDTNGNIIELTPPGRPAHTFEYTAADLVAVYRAPDVGDGLNLTTVAYSSDRQVELVTLPGGDSVDPEYDQSGRLASVTIGRGQYVLSYDASTGQLKSITAPDGGSVSTSYEGFLVTGQTWAGEIQGSVSQTYDNDFRVVTQSVNGSDTVSFGYDRDGLLLRAGDMFLSREAGNGVLLGSLLGTLSDEYTYDDFGEVTGYSARADGGSLYSIQYSRDSIGRIIEKRETENGTTRAWAYTHDIGGRLVEVRRDGQPTSTYSYDANGNRLSRIKPGASEVGTYDVQDRMLSYGNSNFTYSPDGRLQGKVEGSEVTTYSYDELGNLILVGTPDGSTIEYIIDGQNRRVGRKVNGVVTHRWLYEGALRPIAELDAAGNLVSRFVYGAKINVPDFLIRGGTVYRIVSDLRGSPRVVVNHGTGEVVQRIDYDEFGIVIEDTNPGFQPFGFAGGLWDPKTGLTRFGARDYDARTGRWTTKDPAGFLGGTNLYAYASNDPESRTDPTGLYVPEDALTSRRSAPVGGRSTPGLVSTIGAQGNCQYFFFGGSVGRGQVTGGGSACTYTQVCLRIGFGAYLGVGAVGGIGYGPPPSEGGEISVGIGADAGGGGLDFGGQVQIGSGGGVSGSGAGPGAGAGAGGSVGIDLCYQDVSSCRPDK